MNNILSSLAVPANDDAPEVPEKKERPFYPPGWYPELSNEDYHGSFGYSSSSLKVLTEKTMSHLTYKMATGGVETESTLTGQTLHTLTLEPHLFEIEFAIRPDELTKPSSRQWSAANPSEYSIKQMNAWDAWEKERGDRTEITEAIYKHARAMADKVREHPTAQAMLQEGLAEQSIYYWYNPEDWDAKKGYDYRIMCKVRPDWVFPGHPVIFDLKSARDASFTAFMKQAKKLGYHTSAAMYLDGCNRNKEFLARCAVKEFEKFVWIVVENEPPYEVALYEASAQDLAEGREIYHRLVRKVDLYNRSEWKGYGEQIGDSIQPVIRVSDMPRWGQPIV